MRLSSPLPEKQTESVCGNGESKRQEGGKRQRNQGNFSEILGRSQFILEESTTQEGNQRQARQAITENELKKDDPD